MSAFRSAGETAPTADTLPPPHGVDDLLALAISQPALALTTAHRLLSGGVDDRARSLAHHAIAIVERDRGRTAEALTHARLAVRPARRAGPEREAEVRATLGTTLAFAGATTRGLAELNRALALTHGDARHRVLHLRGCTYWLLGRYDEALADLTRAITLSRRAGDRLWEGRTLGTRGDVRRAMGDAEHSSRRLRRSGARAPVDGSARGGDAVGPQPRHRGPPARRRRRGPRPHGPGRGAIPRRRRGSGRAAGRPRRGPPHRAAGRRGTGPHRRRARPFRPRAGVARRPPPRLGASRAAAGGVGARRGAGA